MRIITREELCNKMVNNEKFALVEVLSSDAYGEAHLPGAINIPLGDGFEDSALRALHDKREEVVTYCSDENSSASPVAAQRLEALGYEHVAYYERGKLDWMRAGLAVVRIGEASDPRVVAPA